jgi:MFS family permease
MGTPSEQITATPPLAPAPPIAAHPYRLLYAGFMSILASGVGFSIRAGILPDWAREFGFTNTELGEITGGGLTGFGIVILLGSLIADRIGYGVLMSLAFLMHILSFVLILFIGPIHQMWPDGGAYWSLFVSMFLFSIANGLCETVVNPMTATLFPKRKTHYLNILHAGWPGGLILGGIGAWLMNEPKLGFLDWEPGWKVPWLIQMSLFMIPVLIYGAMLVGQRLPRSEASEAGLSIKTMLLQFVSPILILLLICHALVGYVELGTDSWIIKITGIILEEPGLAALFFVYTSTVMFILRFFAGPLERRLTPLGLLFSCAVIACGGLLLIGNAVGWVMYLLAVTVYAVGKTYFWPTMLAVASERFPRGGALAIGAMGGIGMLSAGLLGGPGIGFKQDYYATTELKQEAPKTFERYHADKPNTFLFTFQVTGLSGTRVGVLDLWQKAEKAKREGEKKEALRQLDLTLDRNKKENLRAWWEEPPVNARDHAGQDAKPIETATLFGSRMALIWTAAVPAAMAVLYLLLILYFKLIGGYKPVVLESGGTDLGTGES